MEHVYVPTVGMATLAAPQFATPLVSMAVHALLQVLAAVRTASKAMYATSACLASSVPLASAASVPHMELASILWLVTALVIARKAGKESLATLACLGCTVPLVFPFQ